VLAYDHYRENARNVVSCLLWQQSAFVQLPEIRVPAFGDRRVHTILTGVVSRHCKQPIAGEVFVQPAKILCRRSRRFLRVRPRVDPGSLRKTVWRPGTRNELPDSLCGSPRQCSRLPHRLGLSQPYQVGRNLLFLENLLGHLSVASRPLKSGYHRRVSTPGYEKADELQDWWRY